jgi:hypothetical protein
MRSTAVFVPLAIAAVLSAGCAGEPEPLNTSGTKTVNVTVICEGDSIRATVNPFVVQVDKSDATAEDVQWVLTAPSTVAEITIVKKDNESKKWPFSGGYPVKPTKANSGKSGKMKQNAKKGVYGYNITASCTLPASGKVANVVIDPDMIIVQMQ